MQERVKFFTKTMILLPVSDFRSKLGIGYVPQGREILVHLLLNKILCYRFILEKLDFNSMKTEKRVILYFESLRKKDI